MLTKHIKKQQRGSFYIAVVWTAIFAFLMYIAAQILQNGLGEASPGRGIGLRGRLSSLLRDMEAQGGPARWIVLAICAAAGIYVLSRIVLSLRNMAKKRTKLGSSLCRQAEPGEDFEELCRKVDLDMERGYQEFAGIVFVSSSWIMEDEIMRISRLKSVCDRTDSDEKELILEDVDGSCMTLSFLMRDWAKELLEYLKKHTAIADTGAGEAQGKAQSGRMFSWHVQKNEQQIEQLRALAVQSVFCSEKGRLQWTRRRPLPGLRRRPASLTKLQKCISDTVCFTDLARIKTRPKGIECSMTRWITIIRRTAQASPWRSIPPLRTRIWCRCFRIWGTHLRMAWELSAMIRLPHTILI